MVIFLVIVIGLSGVRFALLLYIQFTASFLIGRERTVNFRNQHLGSHLACDFKSKIVIILSYQVLWRIEFVFRSRVENTRSRVSGDMSRVL